jgi:uncharacterized cysteine cluster protein YcgN (CxxCxxCC family)
MTAKETSRPFWETKTLAEMTHAEWESLCDGCGKCCLHKLQDEDTDEIFYTSVACRLLDCQSCQCSNYPERTRLVPDCVVMLPDNLDDIPWMPTTCAYRLLAEGKPLYSWHPLVSGDRGSTINAGMSIQNRVIPEQDANPDLELYIVDWPR